MASKKTPPTSAADPADSFDPQAVYPTIKDLLDAEDPDQSDPRFPLVLKYWQWEEEETRKRSDYRSTLGSDRGITPQEAAKMFSIGPLESDGDEYMMVHTRYAHRLFIGRGPDPDGTVNRIPGAKNIGTALRHFWYASMADHPYADWALIIVEEELDRCRTGIKAAKAAAMRQLEELAQQGLHLTVLRSRAPVKVDLGFRSPYGFMMALLVVEFDQFVRVIMTLQSKDLIGHVEARRVIREQLRRLRVLFDRITRYQSILNRPSFASLTRPDFAAPKGRTLRQRIADLQAVWPGLPQAVLTGTHRPRHSRAAPTAQEDQATDAEASAQGLL